MHGIESLRVGTWNLQNGGLDGDDLSRLRWQMERVAEQRLDLFGIQEAKWGRLSSRLLHEVAYRLEMPGRFRVPSNHHGCDLVMLVRERPGLEVLDERHDTSGAWWHALGHLRLLIDGLGEVEFLNTHLAPSSPSLRESEAEAFGLFRKRRAIAVGDFNAVAALDDEPDATDIDPFHASTKTDRRAALAMQGAGFVDVATRVGGAVTRIDRTPTVGHTGADRLAYRCDRILYNRLPVESVAYQVIPAVANAGTPREERLSDHHLVVAGLEFSTR